MKVSDSIAKMIKTECNTAFGVTGGNIINLVDSFYKNGMRVIPMHHEQSAAIASDAYAKMNGFGICFGTSGPGITNLVTGVACSYYDSTPVLAIGGQVPRKFLTGRDRQMGFQETDGVSLFKPITKMSKTYSGLHDIRMAIGATKKPRSGPVYVEVPDDIQRMDTLGEKSCCNCEGVRNHSYDIVIDHKKPIVIVGYGAKDIELDINCPFLYTWRTKDKLFNHPMCKGGFGTTGGNHGNKLLKEADYVLILGSRIDSHQAPNWDVFASNAHIEAMGLEFPHDADMVRDVTFDWGDKLSITGPDWCDREDDNPQTEPYLWIDRLCEMSDPNDIIIPDMGQIGCITFQRWCVKDGQRLFNGINHSPMGYALPGAIGATIATGRRIIVIVGDGSLMMNLHDLQTISEFNLPINIYVVNNDGYGMIRQTQDDWKQYLGQGLACDFNIPDIQALANAFDIEYNEKLTKGPSISEIKFDNTRIIPKWKFGTEL